MSELPKLRSSDLYRLVTLAGHRKKLEMAIQWMTGEQSHFDRIVFSRPPPRQVVVGQKLAMFEVQAEPGVEQEVEVVLLGSGSGQVRA